MTFEVYVTKIGGEPIAMALVRANDQKTGKSFERGTDGEGYANVALFDIPEGTPITLSVVAGGYLNAIQYPTTTEKDQTIRIVLASFRKPLATWQSPRGAFCIPNALPGAPNDNVWDPAFGTLTAEQQDQHIQAHLDRRHNTMLYQLTGNPYHGDYPPLDEDPARCRRDLLKIRNAGLQSVVIFDDTRWPDLTYLQPIADATQDCVSCVMGIMEVNGVVRDANIVLDLLVPSRKLWPNVKLGVHFTDLMQGESNGLVNFTEGVAKANLNMLFFQGSGWIGDAKPDAVMRPTKDIAARIADFTRRLGGPGMRAGSFWTTLSDGVIDTELYTTFTYRHWMTEEKSVVLHDRVMADVGGHPDGQWVSVPCTGFLDGGSE